MLKLTSDNNVIFELHPHFSFVKDWMMGEVLLMGVVKDDLY